MGKERPLIRYEKLSKEDLVDYCRVYWRRIHNDEMLFNEIYEDIESLKEENKKLKYVIDTLMEKTGIENIKLATWEVFLNPKKRLKLNTDFMEEDTLQELRDLGKI